MNNDDATRAPEAKPGNESQVLVLNQKGAEPTELFLLN